MSEKILIAVIAGGAALLGTIIPTFFNFVNNWQQRRFEARKLILEKQRDVYLDLLLAFQDIINFQSDPAKFYELQRAGLQVSIYGGKDPSRAFQKYYSDLIATAQNKRAPLSNEDHRSHQTKVVNSMRNSMGLPELPEFEIVGFHPQDRT